HSSILHLFHQRLVNRDFQISWAVCKLQISRIRCCLRLSLPYFRSFWKNLRVFLPFFFNSFFHFFWSRINIFLYIHLSSIHIGFFTHGLEAVNPLPGFQEVFLKCLIPAPHFSCICISILDLYIPISHVQIW